MYELLKEGLLFLLRVPPEPLDPMGDVQSLQVFRAARRFLYYRLVPWAVGHFLLCLALIVISVLLIHRSPLGLVLTVVLWLLFALVAFLTYAVVRLDYEMRWYKVSDRSLRIREGVLFVREMTMTFANIQNLTITQGPLQKLFGIADLKVQSAGGGVVNPQPQQNVQAFDAHTAFFRGVDNAEAIRDLMLARLKRLHDAGLGDHEDRAGVEAQPGAAGSADALAPLRAALQEARRMRQAAEALVSGGQAA